MTCVKEKYPYLFVAIFLILLLLPLQKFPGSFQDYATGFWGYPELVRVYTAVRLNLLNDAVFAGVFARENNWLVYTEENSLDDFQNTRPFSEAELAKIQQNLDEAEAYLNSQGIKFLVVLVPGKNTVYPEYLPPQVPVIGAESQTDQILAYQNQHGRARILDLRPALLEARNERQVYLATDTHWNDYGILAGYQAIIGALREDFPNLQAHTLEDFRAVPDGQRAGDLSERWLHGLVTEERIRLEPRFERKTEQFQLGQKSALVPGWMLASYNPDPSLPSAIILHDSFFIDMVPFLSDNFRWAIFHWSFQLNDAFVSGEKPDVVILEVTDRYLFRLLNFTR
jgi:hypothetical protein